MPLSRLGYIAILPVIAFSVPASAREQIRIVGSSTVYPFITVAAEQFGQGTEFKTPIVESIGTGGGFKMFCSGIGDDFPDINNASRAITDSEKETCAKNGITAITEIPIGYDGIVLAAGKKAGTLNISRKQLFMALGKKIPKDGKLADNTSQYWSDVDPSLPKQPIMVYGPPPTSGTRDAFVELAFEGVCKDLPEFKEAYPDSKERAKKCHLMREDGKFIEAGEDDNMIVRKLELNADALGILGYSFMEENGTLVHGTLIDGVIPTFENIASGDYKLSRLLYIYVKDAHTATVPGLKEFAREVTLEGAMGPDGYMARRGLISLKEGMRGEIRTKVSALQ
jgi:phosphate transport system substrate-binding protein